MKTHRELAELANVKLVENIQSGGYLVRYGFREVGESIKYVTSQYPIKPSINMINKSFLRFLKSVDDEFEKEELIASFDINDYREFKQ